MANPIQGEAAIVAGGTSHTLRLGVRSMMQLEREFGKSFPRIMEDHFADAKNLTFDDVSKLIWAALQRKEGGPSKDEVVDLMDEAGMTECGRAVAELLAVTFPTEEGEDGNPPKASQESTGEN